jgi:hypothetical protein
MRKLMSVACRLQMCVVISVPAAAETAEDRAPDGGWGWVVAFGATMTHFLLVGMARCLGVIYLCLRERYHSSAANTAWVAAAFNTSRTLTGQSFST